MSFRYFFPLARRPLRRKGRGDGRACGPQFEKFVRRPFHDRVAARAFQQRGMKHNAFDTERVRQITSQQPRQFNAAHTPLQALRREVKRERLDKGLGRFLPK
ncbi:uncharacterized protein TM35_000101190 [Trypanosoma theileri]|uniref:Uncharacterized protein n=1 Tax=Trypanosoma theileri TaxID=67003 RepID=A0A1X0NZ30_9TRYP|nr:uncharacterized protein TM35_000101190 [Trypanosoma theileri]ORC89851.1 hypothetical protein TM35_000101190 [Trypanosoma theileri]